MKRKLLCLLLSLGATLAQGQTTANASLSSSAPSTESTTLVPRMNRHALIIGVSRYADPEIPPLPGARIDKHSATQMARAMQVPPENIIYLEDDQATSDNIRQALKKLSDQVQNGDRVFIHFSGHGTRYMDPSVGGCVEALLTYEGGPSSMITNHEMADLLKTITNKTDKLFVMYDACHSGGVVQAASSTRTRSMVGGQGALRPKFANLSEACSRPTNIRTRSLIAETGAQGALPQDIIHVSASRNDEISFDDERNGGLATQYMRDCMLRDAQDLDNSGAISIEEIQQCAQQKIDQRMANDPYFKAHHLTLNGNAAFVPAWFSQVSAHAAPANAATAPPLTGEQALRQMFDQRDAKRQIRFSSAQDTLRIGRDTLALNVESDRAGYVYVAMVGSDSKSVYLLFPNDLDPNNRIEPGKPLQLPRTGWRVKASGPAGTDKLLVLVADGPRDLGSLAGHKAGPFLTSLNDAQGRAQLGALMTASRSANDPVCAQAETRRSHPQCSDAYGAAMLSIEEIQ